MLLVLANGFFVAAEFALVKIRATQLQPLARKGDWQAKLSLKVVKRLDAFLSVTQFGITLASLGLGWAGKPYLVRWIEPALEFVGLGDPQTADHLSYVIAFGIISFLHIVLGELAPKSLAIQHPRVVSLWVAPPLMLFYYIFWPAIWILNGSANWMLRVIGIPPASGKDHDFSHEELGDVLRHSTHAHPADELINKLMIKALRLKETTAEQVMVPVERVSVLWRGQSLAENLNIAQKCGFSRLPVCGETRDEIVGVVLVKELLWQYQALGTHTDLNPLLRPPLTFFPTTKLPVMLELFRKSRNHLAVVLDKDEHMVGIVCFEDVLEELVGDIRDEFDIEKGPYFEKSETMVLVDAHVSIRDLGAEMNWPFPTNTTMTVEDWCVQKWGYHAPKGRTIEVDGFRVIAEDVSPRGLRRVRFEKLDARPASEEH